jgi:two-component system KDP operon response regulator KdpE
MPTSTETGTEDGEVIKAKGRPKIMIVDDDPALRQALHLRLHANSYETVSASNGQAALALAQTEQPDLVLLDLGLPMCNGLTVLKYMQEFTELRNIPVIVLTARDPQTNEMRSLEAGAVAFFQKPADNEELLSVIRICLDAGRTFAGRMPS